MNGKEFIKEWMEQRSLGKSGLSWAEIRRIDMRLDGLVSLVEAAIQHGRQLEVEPKKCQLGHEYEEIELLGIGIAERCRICGLARQVTKGQTDEERATTPPLTADSLQTIWEGAIREAEKQKPEFTVLRFANGHEIPIVVDRRLEPGTIELRNQNGALLGKIVGLDSRARGDAHGKD